MFTEITKITKESTMWFVFFFVIFVNSLLFVI